MRSTTTIATLALALVAAGCGSSSSGSARPAGSTTKAASAPHAVNPNSKEKSPPGDIPDTTVFVRYRPAGGGFSVKVPEGWARTGSGSKVTFTSNLNSVTIERRQASAPLSVAAVKRSDAATLARTQPQFRLQAIQTVHRSGGTAVRIRYMARGAADPVTGKAPLDAIERYLLARNGTEVVLTLAGPKGADNVDPWRTISDSVRWGA
jgi:hypothetical protein